MASPEPPVHPVYNGLVHDLNDLIVQARRSAARATNSVMTATYWEIGRRIVEFEQGGETRAEHGKCFYQALASFQISETVSRKSSATISTGALPLPAGA
jgi:DUF1016 N-terminal domain